MKYTHVMNAIKAALGVAYILFLLKQFFVPVSPLTAATVHVYTAVALVFLFQPLDKEFVKIKFISRSIDFVLVGISLYLCYHYYTSIPRLETRLEMIDDVLTQDRFAFIAGFILLAEGVRRSVGFSLLSVVSIFVLYGFCGNHFPGWMSFEGFSLDTMAEMITMQTEGLFGITSATAINFVFFFVMFGCVFTMTGGGKCIY